MMDKPGWQGLNEQYRTAEQDGKEKLKISSRLAVPARYMKEKKICRDPEHERHQRSEV